MIYLIITIIILFLILTVMFFFANKLLTNFNNHAEKQLLYNFTPIDSNYSLNDLTTYFKNNEIIEYEI